MANHNIITEASGKLAFYPYEAEAVENPADLDEAYREGAFFAETDWQWALKEPVHARPANMAEHRAMAWAFISGTVCPAWQNEDMLNAFYLGYEDRATELADAGEAGYKAMAEAGSVAATAGWILQTRPWINTATKKDKAIRTERAAGAGAAQWQVIAAASKQPCDLHQVEQALARADAAGKCALRGRDFLGNLATVH
ncbi:hypothetical protein [Robbsia sp. KACC 23696]|uniref:hypothetical protein n=1 Tax=Robbsia sp. KACC 23696 TaxID=3149231 RepID=UPI00325A4CD2